jgi:predicted DNA-binding transcriptional regulator AlpA
MQLLSWKQLAARISVSVSTAKRLHAQDPRFPKKLRISSGRVGFAEEELDRWLAELAKHDREMAAI